MRNIDITGNFELWECFSGNDIYLGRKGQIPLLFISPIFHPVPNATKCLWAEQGCQSFLGTCRDTKTGKMYQINTKCTKWSLNIPNVCKIFQMAINFINIFQSKDLQNLPKLRFLVWKKTIWQPWSGEKTRGPLHQEVFQQKKWLGRFPRKRRTGKFIAN
jgi:hypothetical protein